MRIGSELTDASAPFLPPTLEDLSMHHSLLSSDGLQLLPASLRSLSLYQCDEIGDEGLLNQMPANVVDVHVQQESVGNPHFVTKSISMHALRQLGARINVYADRRRVSVLEDKILSCREDEHKITHGHKQEERQTSIVEEEATQRRNEKRPRQELTEQKKNKKVKRE